MPQQSFSLVGKTVQKSFFFVRGLTFVGCRLVHFLLMGMTSIDSDLVASCCMEDSSKEEAFPSEHMEGVDDSSCCSVPSHDFQICFHGRSSVSIVGVCPFSSDHVMLRWVMLMKMQCQYVSSQFCLILVSRLFQFKHVLGFLRGWETLLIFDYVDNMIKLLTEVAEHLYHQSFVAHRILDAC